MGSVRSSTIGCMAVRSSGRVGFVGICGCCWKGIDGSRCRNRMIVTIVVIRLSSGGCRIAFCTVEP